MIENRKPRGRQEPTIAMPEPQGAGNGPGRPQGSAKAEGPGKAPAPEKPSGQERAQGTTAGPAPASSPAGEPAPVREAQPEETPRREAPGREATAQEAPARETPAQAAPAQPEPAEARPQTGGSEPSGSDRAAIEELEGQLAALEAEKADLKDQLLRALADVENTRRRFERELEEKLKYAPAPLVKDLLGVADNLGRALNAVPAEIREQEAVKNLIAGVEMTEKALLEAFAKHGIRRIDPLGHKLDPHLHEAMMEIQDPSKPAGTVAQVFEAGYEMKGRLLRPARVGVAKGGPAIGEAPPEPGSTVDTEA